MKSMTVMDFSGLTFLLNVHHIGHFPDPDQILSMLGWFLISDRARESSSFKALLLGMLSLVFTPETMVEKSSEELSLKTKYGGSLNKGNILNNQKQAKVQKLTVSWLGKENMKRQLFTDHSG